MQIKVSFLATDSASVKHFIHAGCSAARHHLIVLACKSKAYAAPGLIRKSGRPFARIKIKKKKKIGKRGARNGRVVVVLARNKTRKINLEATEKILCFENENIELN